jgi:predicted nucleic acid-binding protein
VLIELQRPKGNQQVRDRVAELHQRQVFISVISIGELTRGIALIENDEARRHRVMTWMDDLLARYTGHILAVDLEIGQIWGELTAAAALRGHTVPATDGQIAATARRHGLLVMTRNERHFQESGVGIVNPWNA